MMLMERKRMQVGDKRGEGEGCQATLRSATEEEEEKEQEDGEQQAAVCGNNRVYFSQTGVSKGSHGRRENETTA